MLEMVKYSLRNWLLGDYDESDEEFEEFFRKIEKAKVKKSHYTDIRSEREVSMKKIKRKSKNYPLEVILSTGEHIIIPRQSQFKNEWLREHGCSLMAEYIALQFLGVKKITVNGKHVGIYPINLLKWHKKNTPLDIHKKVTVRGVQRGIESLAGDKGKAEYYAKPTAERIEKALSEGDVVIMEQKNPIHTIVLLPDKDGTFIANHGKVEKADINKIAKTATTSNTYRGMIVVSKGSDNG